MTDEIKELDVDEQVAVLTACVKLLAEKLGINEDDLFNEAWESGDAFVSIQVNRRLNCRVQYHPPSLTQSVHYDPPYYEHSSYYDSPPGR